MSTTPSLTQPDEQTNDKSESESQPDHDGRDDSVDIQEQQQPCSETADIITTTVTTESGDTGAPPQLRLVDDEFARAIITTLCDGAKRGREIASVCDASRPTIYRRLNRLESAGFVKTTQTTGPDGHECKEFQLIRHRLTVSIDDGSVVVRAHPQT
ncbi:winged helix-turn-helix domain-containing protein [Haloquadratum walsbyi]|jgi:Sugar-specific transcriptional regulator TrmB.|uniref:Putative transcriptional regulator n=1 Tax=Haloquadratum walsbyi J07HQW2 TaxID=1238425 RepID=U1NIP7_9EURY|nr:winged helix-turn-helix domain-containing protein [Haloquadratum walsbyi]ERG96793.1 MAG: putative transcriptional regulator [Haloquadratum walsbyi J07HQW2]